MIVQKTEQNKIRFIHRPFQRPAGPGDFRRRRPQPLHPADDGGPLQNQHTGAQRLLRRPRRVPRRQGAPQQGRVPIR